MPRMPENLYIGELLSYPGPYAFELGKATIIVVRDEELEILAADPNRVIDLSLTYERRQDSLRGLCERAPATTSRRASATTRGPGSKS